MKSKDKKGNITRTENITKITFEGARIALPVFIDEYSKECDRKNVIENKINTLLTIGIAILKECIIKAEEICNVIFENEDNQLYQNVLHAKHALENLEYVF